MAEPADNLPLNLMIEKSIYRDLTKLSYGNNASLSTIVNDMLKDFMHTYTLSKNMGHMIISKDLAKIAISQMTEDEIKHAAQDNANRYKEGVILENGRPSLAAYLRLVGSFAKANKFEFEISNHPENENQVLIVQFRMGAKFSLYKSETYRILLQEFADIERNDFTDTMVFIEFRPKKDQVVRQIQQQ